jgi:ubiquinone/menaquinone biosynthesis C-methylase UbiE
MIDPRTNLDPATVRGFGDEWSRFDQSSLDLEERQRIFDDYFSLFPWERVSPTAIGADVGCGSGRWAAVVARRVGRLECVDPSDAIEIARRNLASESNVGFHRCSVDALPFPDASLDFAYSLGVLHHVPDTEKAIGSIGQKLKPGAPLLLYLYYAFDNRPRWFRALWRLSDVLRHGIARLPLYPRYLTSQLIALLVYWPLARFARVLEIAQLLPRSFPLAAYRSLSFYTMRTDALDRFGTRLEQRFTQAQITAMLESQGFDDVQFSERVPFWCCVGTRR